jgi:hypothetical protein
MNLNPVTRINSDEGQMGFKAKQEYREVDKLIQASMLSINFWLN